MKSAIAIAAVLLTACASNDRAARAPSPLSMNARDWSIRYSLGLPSRPAQGGTGIYVDLKKDTSEIHMLTLRRTSSIPATSLVITGTIEVSSPDVWFDHVTERSPNPNGLPSSMRLYLERDMYGSEYNRWFSNPLCVVMKPGPFTLTVPLSSELWSSVYGKFGNYSDASRAGFQKVLSGPQAIGLVFGGGDFFGKGVRVRNGTARLSLSSFTIK